MSAKLRALFAALLIIAVAIGGSLYLGYRAGSQISLSHRSGWGGTDVASLDVSSLLGSGSPDQELLDFAFRRTVTSFYKPVSTSVLLRGEHHGLIHLLTAEHVSNATVPSPSASGDQSVDLQRAKDELASVQTRYGAKLGKELIAQAAVAGMENELNDPYTVYLSPREIQGLNESLSGGNFGGIGVYIAIDPKTKHVITDPIEHLPAARAGMKPGDVVTAVDGHSTKGLALDVVERMIRGPAGSTVHIALTDSHGRNPKTVNIVRETIHVPTVSYKMEGPYEYIRLSDFGETSASEIRKALVAGKTQGAKGYILDLRNNGGGLLGAAVQISSDFIPRGTIVSTVDREGDRENQDALGTAIGGLTPLVLLVNQYTASASEITSGALQDYKLATLIGTKTFGKGVVQSIYPLPDNGALKITTARYLTPSGRDIQHKGIQPDQVVTQNPDPSLIDTPKDQQLAAAKAFLRRAASK